MRKRLAVCLLSALLLPLTATWGQQGAAGTIRVVIADATNNPLCTAIVTTDCIKDVGIFSPGMTALIATVPASSFTTANNEHTATIPIPTVPGRRYGQFELFARVNAAAFDGSIVSSVDGATVTMIRRPPPASLVLN